VLQPSPLQEISSRDLRWKRDSLEIKECPPCTGITRKHRRRPQLLSECPPPATAPRFRWFSAPTPPHRASSPPRVHRHSPELPRRLKPPSSHCPSTPHVDRSPRCISRPQTLPSAPSIILLSHSHRRLHTLSRRSPPVAVLRRRLGQPGRFGRWAAPASQGLRPNPAHYCAPCVFDFLFLLKFQKICIHF
jgi:hypothetical protein